MAQRIDWFALQEMVMASALPKPMPTLAALLACVGVGMVLSRFEWAA